MKFYLDRVLASAVLISMFMVSVEVPLWVGLFALIFVFWKWLSEYSEIPKASKKLTGSLSLILLGIILFQYRTLVGQEPAYSYLLGLSALKIMDYENMRDRRFIIMLGFILVSVKALFSVDIYWLAPTLYSFVALWLSLFPAEYSRRLGTFQRISLWSLPLTILLFFAFPRVVLPWALSRGNLQGQIGFSDSLAPGKVAELAAQDQMVMRAKLFQSFRPSELYWRGSVLKESFGLTWGPKKLEQFSAPRDENRSSGSYEIALEPLSEKFLFVLDGTTAVRLPSYPFISYEGGVFRMVRGQKQTVFYEGILDSNQKEPLLDADSSASYLQVPQLPEKTSEWVQSTTEKFGEISERIVALDRFFKEDGFVYTLKPGTYGNQELDEFLFSRKQGFCEHFAGAYGTLARALGIPSRVVVGYQGGRFNPWGDFWMISQKDAHAWVEIFFEGEWVRKDPTQWVAPLRFEIGAEDFFALSPEQQIMFAKDLKWKPSGSGLQNYFETLSTLFENMNYHWTYFLIEFDLSAQRELLAGFLNSDRRLSLLIGMMIASVLSIILVFQFKKYFDFDELYLLKDVQAAFQIALVVPPFTVFEMAAQKDPEHQEFYRSLQKLFDQKWYLDQEVSKRRILGHYFEWLQIKRNLKTAKADLK